MAKQRVLQPPLLTRHALSPVKIKKATLKLTAMLEEDFFFFRTLAHKELFIIIFLLF